MEKEERLGLVPLNLLWKTLRWTWSSTIYKKLRNKNN